MFNSIEAPNEYESLKTTMINLNEIFAEEAVEIMQLIASEPNTTVQFDKLMVLLKSYYKTELEEEGRFHGSVYHKAENLELNLVWYFSSAAFYCMTLFTTIGYGSIACGTSLGRGLSVLYTCIGLPLMLVVLGDLGELLQKYFTKAYILCYIKVKTWRKQPITEDLEEMYLPIWVALPIVLSYVLFCTLGIHAFDHYIDGLPGIGLGDAFYFTFISLTTIGLGDIMPYNIQYSPFMCLAFLMGLALISIINTSIYSVLYGSFFDFVHSTEAQLERIHHERNRDGHGFKVIMDLEPAFRLLACSFPQFEKSDRSEIDSAMRNSFRRQRCRTEVAENRRNPVKRTTSDVAAHRSVEARPDVRRMRAPTLGIFGGYQIHRPVQQRTRFATAVTQLPSFSTSEEDIETDSTVSAGRSTHALSF